MTIPPLILSELVRTPEEPDTTLDVARDLALTPDEKAQATDSAKAPELLPHETRTTQSGDGSPDD